MIKSLLSKIKKKRNFFIILGPIFIFIIYFFAINLSFFIPWTKWETFKTLEHGGTDEEIVLSLVYLGNLKEPKYIPLIMNYINECDKVSGNRRNIIIKFPTPIAFIANDQLKKITGLDFKYDITKDCEDPENQAAIQAWKDWYEIEYEDWRREQSDLISE